MQMNYLKNSHSNYDGRLIRITMVPTFRQKKIAFPSQKDGNLYRIL